MLGDLVSKDTAALSALATLMREAAEAGDELPHALTLDGEAVVVDESLLLLPPPPPPAPPPVEEATDSLRFNVSQLAALGGQLKKAASGHLIRARTSLPASLLPSWLRPLRLCPSPLPLPQPPLPRRRLLSARCSSSSPRDPSMRLRRRCLPCGGRSRPPPSQGLPPSLRPASLP